MSISTEIASKPTRSIHPAPARSAPRPLTRKICHLIRRTHLYFGLFLLPWVVLYGVTAFLFNHPGAFNDQVTTFSKSTLAGTPLETLPTPTELAHTIVSKLNELQNPQSPFRLVGEARYAGREYAFATVKVDRQTLTLFLNVKDGRGMVRATPAPPLKNAEKAPFAVGVLASAGQVKKTGHGRPTSNNEAILPGTGLKLENSLPEMIKTSVPTILERTGYPVGKVFVTSIPDLLFPIEVEGRVWNATYNPMTGAVSGTPGDASGNDWNWRRFLLGLHLARGYPGEANSKWLWALIVDAMALTMCFWGLSGLVMWWQIKATRRLGLVILFVSALAATGLGLAMQATLSS